MRKINQTNILTNTQTIHKKSLTKKPNQKTLQSKKSQNHKTKSPRRQKKWKK